MCRPVFIRDITVDVIFSAILTVIPLVTAVQRFTAIKIERKQKYVLLAFSFENTHATGK